MRRPTSALAAAFLGTALVATTVSAQQYVPSLLGDPPTQTGAPGALTTATPASSTAEDARPNPASPPSDAGAAPPLSQAINPARTAKTLVRNGWDFITYQEYDRALAFFKEADARKAELTDAERSRLKQGIARARQALLLSKKGVKSDSAYAVSDQKDSSRQGGAMTSASRLKYSNSSIPTALQAATHQKDTVELPPLADERPRADDQIARASGDDAQTPAAPPTGQPTLVPEPLPEPASPAAIPSGTDSPIPAAAPDMPPLPALPPPDALLAPEPVSANAPAAVPEQPAAPLTMPASVTPGQAPPAEPAATAPTESPAPDSSALQSPSPSTTATDVESLPPLPSTTDEAPAAEAPGTPSPLESAAPSDLDPPAAAPSSRPESPTTVPDGIEGTSRGVFGRDTLIPQRRAIPSQSLTPELQRDVEEVARQQEENTIRDRATARPPSGVPEEDPIPGLPASSVATRLEISRAPSSTEARPIRAIPVPEEFVPLPKREWNPNRKYWAAAATCHLPLYFQDASLERYGYSFEQRIGTAGRWFSYPVDDPKQSKQRNQVLQPFASMGLFAIQVGLLPWNLIMDPPWESEYDLGYYRPGDRVPTDTFYLPLTGVGPPLHGRRYGDAKPGPASLPAPRW